MSARLRRRSGYPRGAAGRILATVALGGAALLVGAHPARAAVGGSCPQPAPLPGAAQRRLLAALASPLDVWGERLDTAPGGPSTAAARALLQPLFYARAAHRQPLTGSGAYYLPFAEPAGPLGAGAVGLHLADGSQIIAQRVGGRSLTISVGASGRERYGSCLRRLAAPALAGGYLPILETRYLDAAGARYRQESFAATPPGFHALASFVRLRIDTSGARTAVELRVSLSERGLHAVGGRLLARRSTVLWFSPGARVVHSSLIYTVPRRRTETVYLVFLQRPARSGPLPPLARLYAAARRLELSYWERRLAAGGSIVVPAAGIVDAERALLIQNLVLGYRYSVGNSYQEFSFPETIDVARVMGEWGFAASARAIVQLSLGRPPTFYPNWTRGEKLLAAGELSTLFGDSGFLARITPQLAGYVALIARELARGERLLPREHYSSDIPLPVYSLPGQTVVWQGLEAIARAWESSGRPGLAAGARSAAARLHAGLERAVAASAQRLPDGSLFVPAMLLAHERAYAELTRSRLGSYWNLVMPYAFASGFFPPGSAAARAILVYLERHGAFLLGLVRAGSYSLYGRHAAAPVSGTDEVYGTNLARFLADNDRAGLLVLSLFAQLADTMSPGTFVSGEADSIAPLPGERERAMYLPPNSAANAAFLETLRLTLLHESDGPLGEPEGLELGYATPRSWLAPGRTIRVSALPTSFGPISFTITCATRSIRVELALPPRSPRLLRLRLRLPGGERIARVSLDGRPYRRVDAKSGTIGLGGRTGRIELAVALA